MTVDEALITPDAYASVVDACQRGYPAEVCGLVGARSGVLVEVLPVANSATGAPGGCGFRMESVGQLRAVRHIDECSLELGAIYHSHPTAPPVPSSADIELAAYPEVAYLIIGVSNPDAPEARAWRIIDGSCTEIALIIGAEDRADSPSP